MDNKELLHHGMRVVASPYVRPGTIVPHPVEPSTWLVHSLEDFRYMWDHTAMAQMGIRWTREDAKATR